MLSTLLVSVPWLAFTVLVAVVLIAPVVGVWLAARSRVTVALLGVASIAIAGATLYPEDGRSLAFSCAVEWPHLAPTAVESTANVLLFLPVAFLAGIRWRRPVPAALAASSLSALIELVQAVTPALGRACDTSDWITNSIGALLGGVLAAVALAWHRRRTSILSGTSTRPS